MQCNGGVNGGGTMDADEYLEEAITTGKFMCNCAVAGELW